MPSCPQWRDSQSRYSLTSCAIQQTQRTETASIGAARAKIVCTLCSSLETEVATKWYTPCKKKKCPSTPSPFLHLNENKSFLIWHHQTPLSAQLAQDGGSSRMTAWWRGFKRRQTEPACGCSVHSVNIQTVKGINSTEKSSFSPSSRVNYTLTESCASCIIIVILRGKRLLQSDSYTCSPANYSQMDWALTLRMLFPLQNLV